MGQRKQGILRSIEEKKNYLKMIHEAISSGGDIKKVCEDLGISARSYQRWSKGKLTDERKGAVKKVPKKLTEEERQKIIEVSTLKEYAALAPAQLVPTLLDKGLYIGSVSTIHRVLKEARLLTHRRNSSKPRKYIKTTPLTATGPGQVWSWDISYLKTSIRGVYFYLYLFIDIWSRKIIGYHISNSESSETAADIMIDISKKYQVKGVWLHNDNGGPMKGSSFLATLDFLGVLRSHSRPRVSNDNPYSESLFKTLKYKAGYPNSFETIDEANEWMEGFTKWYNSEHKHSGIDHISPNERHDGLEDIILKKRKEVLLNAYNKNPIRWSGKIQKLDTIKEVSLKNAIISVA